jgi:hypothetical protein
MIRATSFDAWLVSTTSGYGSAWPGAASAGLASRPAPEAAAAVTTAVRRTFRRLIDESSMVNPLGVATKRTVVRSSLQG